MELEKVFREKNEKAKLESIQPYDAHFCFVRQQEMQGTGHAMLDVEPYIGDEPFVMAYPDDLHFGEKPLALQLIERYKDTGKSVLATLHDPPALERYGVLDLEEDGETIKGIVEKPAPGTAPSKEASIGRFLLTPDIFPILRKGWAEHTGPGEFYHTYGLEKLIERRQVIHHQTEGKRLDTGTPEGYLEAIIEYAKDNPSLRDILLRSARDLKG
jgi:UTP--glucose-1-phosphate uridylyltransferase